MLADETIKGLEEQVADLTERLLFAEREASRCGRLAAELADENERLFADVMQLRPRPAVPPLAGRRIGIIGHPAREAGYRAVIRGLGGTLEFATADGDKLGQVDRVVQKAHGTLFLTAWGGHVASQRASAAAERYGRPVVFSPAAGLAAVEEAVLEQLLPFLVAAASA